MNKKGLLKVCIGLFLASVCIYALQILLFHDARNTAFYIFQDFAFLPLTILIIVSNPYLLEHEMFMDLLWAVLHLDDELSYRNQQTLTHADIKHLELDAQRVYNDLIKNWGSYQNYIIKKYPYFYNSAVSEKLKRKTK